MAVPGTIVSSGNLVTPGGDQGLAGTPAAISTDAGNAAVLGSDNNIYVGDSGIARVISQRTRGYNAIGNSTFEVDQISCGATSTITGAVKLIDRYFTSKAGTMVATAGQQGAGLPDIMIPGTSFRITRAFYRITLTTAQASLGANDALYVNQNIEGPNWRELSSDVHSFSLLVRSSVAPLNFGVVIKDPPTVTKTLSKLCTISSSNTWQLIQLPNLPVWPSGNWQSGPGLLGYQFNICLAAGSSVITPSNDTWLNGNWHGAFSQDNFASKPVNSTFDIAFVQHEPGPICTAPIDKPFSQNYDECLRYYCKSYDYEALAGAVNNNGLSFMTEVATTQLAGVMRFPKSMAKAPTITIYNHATGAVNNFRLNSGTDYAVTSVGTAGKTGFYQVNTATMSAPAVGNGGWIQYTADTGW
jgi:hypothetical protein